jgi:type IV pilus assembly protein PilQ
MKMNKQARKLVSGIVFGVVVAAILGAGAAPVHAGARSKARQVAAPRAATTSFNFSNIPVRSALQLIAEEADLNLVVSDSVQGTITLHLDDVTWGQALAIVLRLKGLEYRVEGKTLSVTGR